MGDVVVPEKRVLLVEPYSSGRVALGAAIAELGYSLVDVATAEQGREIVEHESIDVVIADVDDEGTRRLLRDLQSTSIGIVMLTTSPHLTAPPRAILLEKPTGLDALSEALAQSLRSR